MKRINLALAVMMLAAAAFAQNPHFVSGPTVTFGATTVTATGSVAGLGNQPITVELEATGTRTVQCQNPGGNIAPGQTQQIHVAAEPVSITPDRRGRANFTITTPEPPAPGPDACPNPRWTVIPGPVTWTSATLTVSHAGQEFFQRTFFP